MSGALLLWACDGDKDDPVDAVPPDVAADADTDSDTDSDTDTDADTDTGGPLVTLVGSLDYALTQAVLEPEPEPAATACDLSYALTGVDYVGSCPGCELAFEVRAVPPAPPDAGCVPDPFSSLDWSAQGPEYGALLAFAPSYADTYTDALLSSFVYRFEDYTVQAGYWLVLRADGLDEDETFSFDGAALRWSDVDSSFEPYGPGPHLQSADASCPPPPATVFAPADPVVGDTSASGQVECALALHGDLYELALPAGARLQLSVDTTSASSAFDPRLTVLGPDGCLAFEADENYPCSFAPPGGSLCPAGEMLALEAGLYQIMVAAYPSPGSCADGALGAYVLQVASPDEPIEAISPSADELLLYAEYRLLEQSVELSLELAP